jgi:chitin synthase
MRVSEWCLLARACTEHPIYSFGTKSIVCNLHDVSWGTKGDNAAPLAAVKSKDGQSVTVEVPTDREDINSNYDKFIRELRQPRPVARSTPDARTRQEDYFRSFRTNIVMFWMVCPPCAICVSDLIHSPTTIPQVSNAFFIIILTNDAFSTFFFSQFDVNRSTTFNPYLAVGCAHF